MIYTRLTFNNREWQLPSGQYGKSKNINTHECDYGFGFEEWLFSKNHVLLDKDGKKYHYGYLEGINKNYNIEDENDSLTLFTINNTTRQRFIVCVINVWKSISTEESAIIVQQNPLLIDSMREQVRAVVPDSQLSVDKFNKHVNNDLDVNANRPMQLFNIKFQTIDFTFDSKNPVEKTNLIAKFNRFWLHRR
ncbi:MAG: hypothetical protein NT048_00565 [Flavobacterium sp.]|nr:hypothetical protein [Flavobacterium sp.]